MARLAKSSRRALLAWLGIVCAAAAPFTHVVAADAKPDWTGVYDLVGDLRFQGEEFTKGKPRDPVLEKLIAQDNLEGLDAIVTAHLQPWAVARMHASDSAVDDLGAICGPTGLFRYPSSAGGLMWLSTPGKEVIAWAYLEAVGVRRIHLDSKHPRNLLPTWGGHSIGHWEGRTLVVDTIGFNDQSWLQTSMQPHTEALHVVERISAIGDGSILEVRTTVDDRKALTGPYSYTRHFKKTRADYREIQSQCNREPGDQQMWNYMRNGALKKYSGRTPRK